MRQRQCGRRRWWAGGGDHAHAPPLPARREIAAGNRGGSSERCLPLPLTRPGRHRQHHHRCQQGWASHVLDWKACVVCAMRTEMRKVVARVTCFRTHCVFFFSGRSVFDRDSSFRFHPHTHSPPWRLALRAPRCCVWVSDAGGRGRLGCARFSRARGSGSAPALRWHARTATAASSPSPAPGSRQPLLGWSVQREKGGGRRRARRREGVRAADGRARGLRLFTAAHTPAPAPRAAALAAA